MPEPELEFDPGATTDTEPADARAAATPVVTLIMRGVATPVDYRPGDTVLDTARRAGVKAPFSCEMGNCATCLAIIREGTATMRVNNALTADEVAEGLVLTCQALPSSPTLTIEYERSEQRGSQNRANCDTPSPPLTRRPPCNTGASSYPLPASINAFMIRAYPSQARTAGEPQVRCHKENPSWPRSTTPAVEASVSLSPARSC